MPKKKIASKLKPIKPKRVYKKKKTLLPPVDNSLLPVKDIQVSIEEIIPEPLPVNKNWVDRLLAWFGIS